LIACGETAGYGHYKKAKLRSRGVDSMASRTSLLRSFTILVGAFQGLAPWATSLSCSAANCIARQIYPSTDAPSLLLVWMYDLTMSMPTV
jgi:hypothetical protein